MNLDFNELLKGVDAGLEKQAKSPDYYFQQLADREREQQRRFSAVPSWSTPLEPTAIPKSSFSSPEAMLAAQAAPEVSATKITRQARRKNDYRDQGLDLLKDTAVKIPPTRPPTPPITAPLAAPPTAQPETMRADQLHTGFFDAPDFFSRGRTHSDVVNRVDIATRARYNELHDYYDKAENALRRTGNPQQMANLMAEKKEAFRQHNDKFLAARKFTGEDFPGYQRQMADYNANQAAQAKATAAGYDPLRSTGQDYTKVTPPTFPKFDSNNEYLAAAFPNANPKPTAANTNTQSAATPGILNGSPTTSTGFNVQPLNPYGSQQAQQPLSTPTNPPNKPSSDKPLHERIRDWFSKPQNPTSPENSAWDYFPDSKASHGGHPLDIRDKNADPNASIVEELPFVGGPLREQRKFNENVQSVKDMGNKGLEILTKLQDKAKEFGTGLGLPGAIAGNLLPLGGAALLAYLMTRDRNRSGGGQGQNININVGGGGQGRTPAFFNRVGDVSSLSDAKFGSLKEAGVADAVSKAIQTRAINKVLDKAEEEGNTESRPSEKEVEITSKYPQMQKMLEDKQNKAYLERLLKD